MRWVGGLCDRLKDGGAFLYLLLLLLYPFLLVLPSLPSRSPLSLSSSSVLVIHRIDASRFDRAAEPRDLSQLISAPPPFATTSTTTTTLLLSSSCAELNYSCLIFNLPSLQESTSPTAGVHRRPGGPCETPPHPHEKFFACSYLFLVLFSNVLGFFFNSIVSHL